MNLNQAVCVGVMSLLTLGAGAGWSETLPTLAVRGHQTMAQIEKDFRGRGKHAAFYLEDRKLDDPKYRSHPAFAWPAGVQLSALLAGAKIDPSKYRQRMNDYVRAIDTHWLVADNIGGFCAGDHPTGPDRYYDDNAWLVLTFAEAYELTKDPSLLKRAVETMKFVQSGEDDKLGGGIYWHEQKKESKNTCINAPATACALTLYKLTKDETYLATAKRLYAWTKKNLQDPDDGLYFDNIKLDGNVDKSKYSYNTALMIRSAVLFYDQTGDRAYLEEATRLAKAAEAKWFKPDGAVADDGFFAHLLAEAMLDLGERTGDGRWRELTQRTADYIWQHCRDNAGRFPAKWNQTSTEPWRNISLMPQAAAARLFFVLATTPAAKT